MKDTAPGAVFLVQGSSPNPYTVIFYPEPFSISCTCTAGMNGLPCKHRLSILQGNDPGIIQGDKSFLSKIAELVKCTNLMDLLGVWDEAKKEKNNARKRTEYAFKNYKELRINQSFKKSKNAEAINKELEALDAAIDEEAAIEKKADEALKALNKIFITDRTK